MPSYFDLHFHPVFKQYITKFETDYPSKRTPEDLEKRMDLKNDLLDLVDEVVLHILESQSCVDQMQSGGIRLGVANIASMELGIADSQGFIASILRSKITKPMDQAYMRTIRNGGISYYHLFIKELDLYRKLNAHKSLQFLSRKNRRTIDENGAYMVLGMEGGHNLSRKKIGTDIPDTVSKVTEPDVIYEDFRLNPHLNADESLRHLQQALWDSDLDLFSVTLTHLTFIAEQHLATHAFGLKLLQHDAFYPVGNGISELGKKVIDAAYSMKVKEVKTPIFIDLKHMSLKSRQDLYQYRKEKNYRLPLLATHMGVSGYSTEDWKQALTSKAILKKGTVTSVEIMTERKKAGEWGFINKEFTFNPWTINLMDDDIIEILDSEGLIGISLDVRILGFQAMIGASSKDQSEYLSPEDFKTHFPDIKIERVTTESLESAEILESWLKPTKEERHPLCMCFNILHIVSVGLIATDKDPWKHITIGSDFDGLIDPVKICRDSSKMQTLETDLLRWLPIAEKAYIEQNGGPELLAKDAKGKTDLAVLKKLVRQVMYENGRDFIQKWINGEWMNFLEEMKSNPPTENTPGIISTNGGPVAPKLRQKNGVGSKIKKKRAGVK